MKTILNKNPDFTLYRGYLTNDIANSNFESLVNETQWKIETLTIFGKKVLTPRLVFSYSDAGISYKYSGVTHSPLYWPKFLEIIRDQIAEDFHYFNFVLLNLYRHGKDYMGYHRDNEKTLKPNPVIASLSLGETRTFRFRHYQTHETLSLELSHGDLLLIHGDTNTFWEHTVPKRLKVKKPRINLTFRSII